MRRALHLWPVLLAATALLGVAARGGAAVGWQRHAAMPEERSEVAAAAVDGELVVVGGFVADGHDSARADAYCRRPTVGGSFPTSRSPSTMRRLRA